MNKRTKINRLISAKEIEVVRITLEHAATAPEFRKLIAGAEGLQVVGKCDCGCDSVDFVEQGKAVDAKPIADGTGNTYRGGKVGVIVWGTQRIITGLEIYDLGAGDKDIKLPIPESIMPFEKRTP